MAWASLLLLSCGDPLGPEQTPLCVEPAFEVGEGARVMAIYHAPDDDPVLSDAIASARAAGVVRC